MMPAPEQIARQAALALEEDIGSGDVTAELIDADSRSRATVITREDAILCGQDWFNEVFHQLDTGISVLWFAGDGDRIMAEQIICELEGPTRALLTGERTALNFLQLLSATATVTRAYVDLLEGSGVTLLDTRKTIPGLRAAQKYAVTCGGGQNHRMGLHDAVLIKENHICAVGSVRQAVLLARELHPELEVEVETENLAELQEAINAGADIVMLDNYSLSDLFRAVSITNGLARLEASGGISLDNFRSVAKTGVDYISMGTLTKDVAAIDLSMEFHT